MSSKLRILFRRMAMLRSFLRGDSIVLTVKQNGVLVDAGQVSRGTVKKVASVFFEEAITL